MTAFAFCFWACVCFLLLKLEHAFGLWEGRPCMSYDCFLLLLFAFEINIDNRLSIAPYHRQWLFLL